MKTRIILSVFLFMLTIHIYGQINVSKKGSTIKFTANGIFGTNYSQSYDTKDLENLINKGKSNSVNYNRSNSNDLSKEIGGVFGDAIGEFFKSFGNSTSPAAIYYDDKGIPYSSAKAAAAANAKYEKDQKFIKGQQDLLKNLKGRKAMTTNKLEMKGKGTTTANNLELKGQPRPIVPMEYKNTMGINNPKDPNSSLVYTGKKSSAELLDALDGFGLEAYVDALDYTLKEPPKPHWEPTWNITETNDWVIDMVADCYGLIIPLEAEASLPPGIGKAVGVIGGATIDAGAELAHGLNHGQSLNDIGLWKNTGLTFVGSVASDIPTEKRFEETTRKILIGAAVAKSKGESNQKVITKVADQGITDGFLLPFSGKN